MNIRDYPTLKELLLEMMVALGLNETGHLEVHNALLTDQWKLSDAYIEDCEDADRGELILPVDLVVSDMDSTRTMDEVLNSLRGDINIHIMNMIHETFVEQMQPMLDQHYKEQGEPSRIYGD